MPSVTLGHLKMNPRESMVWDSSETTNFHWIIVGGSGAGKTYQIRRITNALKDQIRLIHIFDPHGDILTDPDYTSSLEFSEVSNYGVRPLTINPDPRYGGMRRKINSFVGMINRYSKRKLTDEQESAMRYLLIDFFSSRGCVMDDPDTWGDQNLEFGDFLDFVHDKLVAFLGDVDVEDQIKYGSFAVLKSVHDRLQMLKFTGVFKPGGMPFQDGKSIRHYNMSALTVEEQGYLVELVLEQVFIESIKSGFKTDVDTLVVIDEAQRFIDRDDADHIVSVISREGRKFGMGLMLATQNCSNFPEDILINSAAKMVLGIDEAYVPTISKAMAIDPNRIRYTQPRKGAMVQIKTHKISKDSRFVDIVF